MSKRSKRSKRSKAASQPLASTTAPSKPPPACIPMPLLPDHILSAIVSLSGGPRHSYDNNRYRDPAHVGRLQKCSLVCRRWRTVTLPHLFYCVCVGPLFHDDESGTSRALEFLEWLAKRPEIASVIQEACFCHLSLDVNKALKLLPRLRTIRLSTVTVVPRAASDAGLRIGKLQYSGGVSQQTKGEFVRTLADVLSSFSEIGELQFLDLPSCLDELHVAAKSGLPALISTLISSVDLANHSTTSPRVFQLFGGIGLLNHLTCLSVGCEVGTNMDSLSALNDVLHMASATLGEFHLDLRRLWEWTELDSDNASPSKDMAVRALSTGLRACKSLHGFRLEMTAIMSLSDDDDFDDERDPYGYGDHYPSVLEYGWLVACAMIALLPTGSKMKHLVVMYCPMSGDCEENLALNSAALLDFSFLQMLCRKFRELRSLKVFFSGQRDFEGFSADQPYIRHALKELDDAVARGQKGGFFLCEEEGCQWRKRR